MAYDLDSLLHDMVHRRASDLHIKARSPIYMRILDQLERMNHPIPGPDDVEEMAGKLLTPAAREQLKQDMQADGMYALADVGYRFRAAVFRQRGSLGIVLRQIPVSPPSFDDLGIPDIAKDLLNKRRGLLLIGGPASCGKTTTVAAILAHFNQTVESHILTLEDPVEYVIPSHKCVVTQRQVGLDTPSFATGLSQGLRQDPDIIYLAQIPDLETLDLAVSAAERDHLVIAAVHTPTVTTTIEHLVGMFPNHLQDHFRTQLAVVVHGIICQALVPTILRTQSVAAFEIMNPTHGMRNLIRQNQIHRLYGSLESSATCCSLTRFLQQLVQRGIIGPDEARRHLAQE
jgi:twitching motility protein PilT